MPSWSSRDDGHRPTARPLRPPAAHAGDRRGARPRRRGPDNARRADLDRRRAVAGADHRLPVNADGGHGFERIWGATGGYIVGFVLAAWIVGALAERGADRRLLAATAAFAFGQLAIFGIGVPWLKVATGIPWGTAIHEGFTIFIVGGLVKAAAGGLLAPSAWRLARRVDGTGHRRDDRLTAGAG